MPRKKLDKTAESPSVTTDLPVTAAPTEVKPKEAKPRVARKPKQVDAPAVEVAQIAETVSEASPVVAVPAAADATPKPAAKGRRGKAALAETKEILTEAPVLETPPQAVPEKAPAPVTPKANDRSRRGGPKSGQRGRKAPVETVVEEPAVVETETAPQSEAMSEIQAAFEPAVAPEAEVAAKPKGRGRGGRGKKAVDALAPAEAEPVETRGDDFDFASFDLPVPVWRARAATPTPAVAPAPIEEAEPEETDAEPEATTEEPARRNKRRRRGRDDRGREDRGGKPDQAKQDQPQQEQPRAEQARQERSKQEQPKQEPRAEKHSPEPVEEPRNEQPSKRTEPDEIGVTFRRERVVAKAPEKAAIAIPDEAPQVVVREGVPTLVRNHKVIPPIMFFGSPSDERRSETVLEEVRMASEAGVHLHSYLIDFEVDPEAIDDAVSFAAYILSRSVQVDSESQVIFRLVIQAPRHWEQKYPNGKYRHVDGSVAEPSVCDDDFWTVARTCLEKFVKKMRLLDLRDHILGVHLERGEWFFAEGAGYDNSRAAQQKFREWAKMRYLNDEVTLRASWFDGSARFDNIQVPEFLPEGSEGDRFIRSSRRQRRYVDYHLFLSDATVQRIADLAYAAKAASDGMFLIGASYGYTFEWSHPASGHLSLGKLLRTPEIDFIAGPPSYRSRQPGGSAAFPGPIDSFALNGKLYISEEDFKTSLSIGHEPDDFNPQLKTPQALESVHWRGVGAALAHASGIAWMDLWGNGWLRTNSVWERAKQVREALIDRQAAPLDDPEVAIFIDERALAYLVDDHAFKLLVQNVRESVLRAGVSAAFYLLSDLAHREKFPESKLYIFVNAWDIRPDLRAAIKSRLQRDNKVLFWLYSAGLFDAGRESLERAREVTGIALKPQPFYSRAGTTILNRRHPLSEAFPDRNLVGGTKLEPSYFAIPEGAVVLGEYTQTGLPSFVVKEFTEGPAETHWTSVFLGEPQVNPALIRALAQMAGAHVWNFQEDVVHVRHPFCTVHCQGAGQRTLTLPGKYSAYNLLTNEWSAVDSSHLRFTAVEGATYCFLVGARHELEQHLNADASKLLYIDKLPPRDSNVRVDSTNFDVPIMKLDEWIEGNDSDDNADEWFLRPQAAEEEPIGQAEESPERVGRRRRRRRGGRNGSEGSNGGDRGGHSFEPVSTASFDDLDLNVMFRKRE